MIRHIHIGIIFQTRLNVNFFTECCVNKFNYNLSLVRCSVNTWKRWIPTVQLNVRRIAIKYTCTWRRGHTRDRSQPDYSSEIYMQSFWASRVQTWIQGVWKCVRIYRITVFNSEQTVEESTMFPNQE